MKHRKIIGRLVAVFAVAAIVAVAICLGWADQLVDLLTGGAGAAGGTMMAAVGSAIASEAETNRGTVESSKVDENGNIVRQGANTPTVWDKITKVYPTKAVFDTLLRTKFKRAPVKTNSFKFEYWSVNSRGILTTVAQASTAGSEGDVVKLTLSEAFMLSLDNNLIVPSFTASGPDADAVAVTNGEPSLTPLVLHIVKFTPEDKQITVFPINAKSVPAIPAGTKLYRMGTAKEEKAAYTDDPTQQPYDAFNYAQIRMLTLSETIYQRMADKDAEWGMADMIDQALYDFRITNEADALFGARGEFLDPISRKVKHTMGGLTSVGGLNTIDVSGETKLTNAIVNHIAAETFFGNNGSDRRVLLMGKDAAQQMQLVESVSKQLAANNTEAVGGIKFKVFEALAGTFDMIYSPVLDLYGYQNKAIAIDLDNVYRVERKPLEEVNLNLDEAGISRSKDIRLDECWTLAVTNPRCHAIIKMPKFSPSSY